MESFANEIVCPIDAEWKFKKSDLIALKDSKNLYMSGKYFYALNIPGVAYSVSINPYGLLERTSIYFDVEGSKKRKVTADLNCFIESANYSMKLNDDFQKHGFLTIFFGKAVEFFESKNKFFVNGEFTVRVKGTLKAQRLSITKISHPISMQWKVKEDDLKAQTGLTNGCLRSKRITVASFSDVKFFLSIRQGVIKRTNQETALLYLNVELGNEKKIEALFDFSVESANFNYAVNYVFERSDGCLTILCPTEDLVDPSKRYFVDGFMTINFQGILMIEKNHYTTLNCKKGFATKAAQKKKDKNFTFVVGEKEIKVHKKVLMDASPVFVAMFESEMKESIENKIIIEDFRFEIVDAAIKLCYSSGVPRKFTMEDILSLYQFAEKYEIKLVMNLVEEYLIKKLSPANVCQLVQFSKTFNATKLYQISIDFLIKCSKDTTPVLCLDILDNDLIAIVFKNTFRPVVVTDI